MYCQKCGQIVDPANGFCIGCGHGAKSSSPEGGSFNTPPQYQQHHSQHQQHQYPQPPYHQSPYHENPSQIIHHAPPPAGVNGVGIAGFVLALLGLFLGWIPIFGWIIWLVGLVLSFVGVFGKPKGLAIAGLVISLATFVIVFLIYFGIGAATWHYF